jgi:hypothetical protein
VVSLFLQDINACLGILAKCQTIPYHSITGFLDLIASYVSVQLKTLDLEAELSTESKVTDREVVQVDCNVI